MCTRLFIRLLKLRPDVLPYLGTLCLACILVVSFKWFSDQLLKLRLSSLLQSSLYDSSLKFILIFKPFRLCRFKSVIRNLFYTCNFYMSRKRHLCVCAKTSVLHFLKDSGELFCPDYYTTSG